MCSVLVSPLGAGILVFVYDLLWRCILCIQAAIMHCPVTWRASLQPEEFTVTLGGKRPCSVLGNAPANGTANIQLSNYVM